MGSQRTKEDDVARISTSIFITNFPETCSAKDLFNTCKEYGRVVDAFIPFKRSKAEKRFGFIRFINVFSVERLVSNLCTIWTDKHNLHANITRFQRSHVNANVSAPISNGGGKNNNSNAKVNTSMYMNQKPTGNGTTYVNAVKGPIQQGSSDSEILALVLDDDCVMSKDLSNCLLGRVKEFASLANIKMTLNNEELKKPLVGFLIMEEADGEEHSDVDSKDGRFKVNERDRGDGSDVEGVRDTLFEEDESIKKQSDADSTGKQDSLSEDPFDIYPLLKKKDRNGNSVSGNEVNVGADDNVPCDNQSSMKSKEGGTKSVCSRDFKKSKGPRTGGSKLILLDDVVKVGQVMGYNMDGCMSNMAEIIESQGVEDVLFILVRGVWRQNGMDFLIVVVYAPHDAKEKMMLWDYLTRVISRWKGKVVVMGDFNEVRYRPDRFGSNFNVQGANVFNSFISNVGLVEVSLGGCSFTWCHKSAKKMSKLDRFLVSENFLNIYPYISAITLERFLSEHRPILLREHHLDYGPTPFRFFHYWCEMDGFNKLVEDA
nr:RNA-directed DNA polymerase, eukaryota, reverse transcriptase zinc-binding domain protein [Tanacetum cinerariifolium]